MEPTYEKVDDTTLKVVKPIETRSEEQHYDLDFLKKQEISIINQRDAMIDAKSKELAEVRALIAKCEELNVMSKEEKLQVEQAEREAKNAAILEEITNSELSKQ
jgi:hypothetical protein